jgi:hypothetical protein
LAYEEEVEAMRTRSRERIEVPSKGTDGDILP